MLLRFTLLLVFVAACFYLQFYLAHRQLRRLKGLPSSEIDPGYIRAEDYFGRSFRTKLRGWIEALADPLKQEEVIAKGSEQIHVITKAVQLDATHTTEEIFVAKGGLVCGPESRFLRELYVSGTAVIGSRSTIQAAAVDGDLRMGDEVEVLRWVDAQGELRMGRKCRVGARVTSATRVILAPGCALKSVSAPVVTTADWDQSTEVSDGPPAEDVPVINTPQHGMPPKQLLDRLNLAVDKWHQLSPDCWLYEGNFEPAEAIWLRTKLVVRGNCRLPAGCVVSDDLKAGHHLTLGDKCRSTGNLVAGGNIEAGARAIFSGVVYAGGSIRLQPGVRGRAAAGPVVVYAAEILSAARSIFIEGKLSAGDWVLVDADEVAG